MKTCSRCKEEKPKYEFYKQTASLDGFCLWCKICSSEYHRKYHKQNKRKIHDRHLHNKYGISLDDYDRMSVIQGHKCAICGSENPGYKNNRFCVDHDHVTGKIRALLCDRCNRGIGFMQDDPDLLEKAATYIRTFQE